ncbi:MAG: YggS family pyridoxal phosphate-dependent enzyme [Myxococcales bacterium]|nr:YggS family pyridoxal phosphate-dependent enzyme [Myxococcales bacterium]
MSAEEAVAERLTAVRERIAAAAARAGRRSQDVVLVGVAKRHSAALVTAAVRAGLRDVGENYFQEAKAKIPEVRASLEGFGGALPRWHFVGRLQRNKARHVATIFDVVQTLDRDRLGAALDRCAGEAGRKLSVLLEVNLSGEPTKGGVTPDALPDLLAASAAWTNLDVAGLMTMPAPGEDPEAARPVFTRLRHLAESLRDAPGGADLRDLSMGMSADFETAIEEGATLVRVGTAIFGPRAR